MKLPKCLAIVAAALAIHVNATGGEIDAVLAHPPLATQAMRCTEHYDGQLHGLGDELGTDCTIARLVEVQGRAWMRDYEGDGSRNEQWYSWKAPVLAPCDGMVGKIHINAKVNEPGIMGAAPASFVVVDCTSDVHILLAHIQELGVRAGDRVKAGQTLARVGNNGMSRSPHVHIGAWRGKTPLQLRWDQREMGE